MVRQIVNKPTGWLNLFGREKESKHENYYPNWPL